MIGLLGKKVGMTQLFDDAGRQVPVTVLEVGPCKVTNIRTKEKNGYNSVQLGFGEAKEKRLTRAKIGQFKKQNLPLLRHVREIRSDDIEGLQVGQAIKVDNFEAGDFVDIEGVSIGKGFQGVVKRHHFKGAQTASHGTKMGREPGSIGSSAFPSRVLKGMKMAGHMGCDQVTVQNLKVVKVDLENNLLVVKGAVPGVEGACLVIRNSLKRGKPRKWKVEAMVESSSKQANPKSESSEPTQETKPEVSEKDAKG